MSNVTVNEIFERSGVRIALAPDPTGKVRFQVITAPTQDPFPRVMLHEGCNGRGGPLVYAGGHVDDSIAVKISRFNLWCVAPGDLYDLHPDAIRRVRALNPKMRILAHVLGPIFWPADGVTYTGRLAQGIGEHWVEWGGWYADLTKPRVMDTLLELYCELLSSGLFDGIMVDNLSYSDTWRGPEPKPDFDDAVRVAKGQLLRALRSMFPKAIIIGNAGPGGHYYGGEVAAPVFSAVMSGALRLLAIPPDDLQRVPATTLVQAQDPW